MMKGSVAILATLALAAALCTTACSAEPDPPGGVTADEARQLNEAAAMLDGNSVDADTLAENIAGAP